MRYSQSAARSRRRRRFGCWWSGARLNTPASAWERNSGWRWRRRWRSRSGDANASASELARESGAASARRSASMGSIAAG